MIKQNSPQWSSLTSAVLGAKATDAVTTVGWPHSIELCKRPPSGVHSKSGAARCLQQGDDILDALSGRVTHDKYFRSSEGLQDWKVAIQQAPIRRRDNVHSVSPS